MHLMNHLCWMQSLKNCLEPLNGHGSSSLGKTCVWPIGFCILSVQLIGPFWQHFQKWYVYIVIRLYTSQVSDIMSHTKKRTTSMKYWISKTKLKNFIIWYTSYILSYRKIYIKHVNKSTGQKLYCIHYTCTHMFWYSEGWSLEAMKQTSTPSWLNPHSTADPCSGGSSCHTWIKDLKKKSHPMCIVYNEDGKKLLLEATY